MLPRSTTAFRVWWTNASRLKRAEFASVSADYGRVAAWLRGLCVAFAAVASLVAGPAQAGLEKVAVPSADGTTVDGWLEMPPGPGPHPMAVLLHGCNGLWAPDGRMTALNRDWAERLVRQRRMGVLLVDSFVPRGVREICTGRERLPQATTRVDDVRGAIAWAKTRPDVAADRIVAMGWSNGARTVLRLVALSGPLGARAAIAFYPPCAEMAGKPFKPAVPLLILIGEADDWTPAEPCRTLARAVGADLELVTYPGAHHGFDAPNNPVRFLPDVRNPGRPDGRGATIGTDPAGRDAARLAVEAFLDRQLGVPSR